MNPFSLSDFPGRVAAVVFTQGCNFRCPYCHNASLLSCQTPDDSPLQEEAVLEFIRFRRGCLDAVVVSGGEPCIQPDLSTFLRRIKGMDLSVKLDTNGSRPGALRELLANRLVDFIAMDLKAPLQTYDHLCGVHVPIHLIQESIELISRSGVEHEFRTTVVDPLLSPADITRIQELVPSGSKHRLQKFCPKHALDPALRTSESMKEGGVLT
jgi:pyruvate formate lyase activating enzyme